MNDELEEDSVPKVIEITTKLKFSDDSIFPEKNVTEKFTLHNATGAFGNDEPVAKVQIISDSSGDLLAEAEMPVIDWTKRLVAMLKYTYITNDDVVDEPVGQATSKVNNINYIYKR